MVEPRGQKPVDLAIRFYELFGDYELDVLDLLSERFSARG